MPSPGGLAVLHYDSPEFDVVQPGHYVVCAVTERRIPVAELRYWSAQYQEAYFDAVAAARAFAAGGGAALRQGAETG